MLEIQLKINHYRQSQLIAISIGFDNTGSMKGKEIKVQNSTINQSL